MLPAVTLLVVSINLGLSVGDTVTENQLPVFSKCCPLNQTLGEDRKTCIDTSITFDPKFPVNQKPPDEVIMKIGLNCQYGRFRLEPEEDSYDEFFILSNGSLQVPYHSPPILTYDQYCLESFAFDDENDTDVTVLPLICFTAPSPEMNWKKIAMILYPVGCLVSVPFLLLTLIVYSLSPYLRDTNGKVLCCHVACLTVAYTSLSIVQLTGSTISEPICVIVAYTIQFSFLSSFFWLNVLCFNTWRRLRFKFNNKPFTRGKRSSTGRRFLYYSIYAWGVPILFFIATVIMEVSPSVPSSYLKPNFGTDTCWFRGVVSEESTALPYFYAPIAIILVMNLMLFVMSALRVWNNHKETMKPPTTMADVVITVVKQRRKTIFIECLLLFLVMGLNWVWEVVSWSVGGPPQIWLVTDLFNTLQGIIVFYVFVVRDTLAWGAVKNLLTCHKSKQQVRRRPYSYSRTSTSA